jgi:hypothetical protein
LAAAVTRIDALSYFHFAVFAFYFGYKVIA